MPEPTEPPDLPPISAYRPHRIQLPPPPGGFPPEHEPKGPQRRRPAFADLPGAASATRVILVIMYLAVLVMVALVIGMLIVRH